MRPRRKGLSEEKFGSGNLSISRQSINEGDNDIHNIITRNYYGADERLYATQMVDRAFSGAKGAWEEYRYDPLGRRVLVRSVREDLCAGGGQLCQSTITRQILWELRAPGTDEDNLEATNGAAAPSGHQVRFGRVSYFHAGGIDRPLTITKDAGSSIIPHQSWRGQFAWGTWGNGTYVGQLSDCTSSIQTNCVNVAWPGWQTNAWHVGGNPGEQEYWMGSLADGMRDVSGQIYMRNRYYDPATGQFTQQDPIGLAGGLNAYGFAAGDPVTYSDPYGLCPPIDSCMRGNGPKTAVTVAEFREGRREHFTWPIDIVVTPTKDSVIRGGLNDAGELVLFMQGGLKLDTDLLPDGAEHIPITLAAINVDTGEFDVFGRIGPNLVTVHASGNYKDGSFRGRVCVAGVCSEESSDSVEEQSPRQREEYNTTTWCSKVGCE